MTLDSTHVASDALVPIPQPRTLPVVGNLLEVDIHGGILGVMDKVAEYGPIFRFRLPGTEMVMVASQELVHELCDESRFDKKVHGALQGVRDFAGDSLFTATPRKRTGRRRTAS